MFDLIMKLNVDGPEIGHLPHIDMIRTQAHQRCSALGDQRDDDIDLFEPTPKKLHHPIGNVWMSASGV